MSEAALLQKCLDDIAEAGKLYKKACDRLREVAEGIRKRTEPVNTNVRGFSKPAPLVYEERLIRHAKQMFRQGQTAFFLDQEGRAHDCTVDGYRRGEILVSKDGKPLGWFTDDTLFHSTTEAYSCAP